jgi:hypothetical protein
MDLLVELHVFAAGSPPAKPRQTRIPDDAQEPRAPVRTSKVIEVSDRAQERVLHRVFRLVRVAEQVARQVVRDIQIRQDALVEAIQLSRRKLPRPAS